MIDLFIHTLFSRDHFTYIFEKKNYCSLMYIRDYYSFTLISKRIRKVQSICLPFLKYIHEFNYFQKKIEILYLKTLVVLIII